MGLATILSIRPFVRSLTHWLMTSAALGDAKFNALDLSGVKEQVGAGATAPPPAPSGD